MALDNDSYPSIELRVERVSQLFNTLDPFPFGERDLDRDAEEFIVSWAQEMPRDRALIIVIHLPELEIQGNDPVAISNAFKRYFSYRAEILTRDLHELLRVGRTALAIGLTILAVSLTAAQIAARAFGDAPVGGFVQESLIIFGWVANWKPIEILLYDWWPLVRRRSLYRRLAKAKVDLRAHPSNC